MVFIVIAIIVMLVNLSVTVWALVKRRTDSNGLGILSEGACDKISNLDRFIHAFINVLSVSLSIGSNFFMQLLASPSREDVDAAHRRREWADIGIQSFKNSWKRIISLKRTFLWLLICVASIPLNLVWNAAIFSVPTAYTYYPIVVSDQFLKGKWFTDPLVISGLSDNGIQQYLTGNEVRQILTDLNNPTMYTEMTASECLKAYAKYYVYDRSDVVLVTSFPTMNERNINGTCPHADGTLYSSPDGRNWQLSCNQVATTDFGLPQPNGAGSITECADLCSSISNCVASFWDSNSSLPNCYLSSGGSAPNGVSTYQASMLMEDSNIQGFNSSVLGTTLNGFWPGPYRWLCPQDLANWDFDCRQQVLRDPDNWYLPYFGHPRVERCYSRAMPQRCRIGFSSYFMEVVIVFNVLKILCFVEAYRHLRRQTKDRINPVFFTADDAIASWLRNEDPESKDICLAEKLDFENGLWDQRWVVPRPMKWRPVSHTSWFRAIGLWRYLYHNFMLLIMVLLPVGYLLGRYSYLHGQLGLNLGYITGLGIGNPSGIFLLGAQSGSDSSKAEHARMIVANLPQLFLSCIAFIYSKHLACMVAANEFGKFVTGKRGLRVSNPVKGTAQRSNYLLSMPLLYAIPLSLFQAVLHYLASQSIFLAKVDILDHHGQPQPWMSLDQIGYSVLGLITFAIVAFVSLCVAIYIGLKRLPGDIPLVASCSAALSAACHPSNTDLHHDELEIMWGVDGDEHCSLTSETVGKPKEGLKYS